MALDDRIRAALDRAMAEVRSAAHAEADEVRQSAELSAAALRQSVTRVSECIAAIDGAASLGAVLAAVGSCARLDAARASVMIVREGHLLAYPSRALVPRDRNDVAWIALEKRVPVIHDDAAAFPITLGGQVAALLAIAVPASPQALTTFELMARHAGRVLEAMTVSQITGLAPLSPRSSGASAGHVP